MAVDFMAVAIEGENMEEEDFTGIAMNLGEVGRNCDGIRYRKGWPMRMGKVELVRTGSRGLVMRGMTKLLPEEMKGHRQGCVGKL